MKYTLAILWYCLIAGQIMAQSDTVYAGKDIGVISQDTLIRKYLVCETRWAVRPTAVFEDGTELEIWDTMGEKIKGDLRLLDGEFIELMSRSGHKDTIHISAVYKIKKTIRVRKGLLIAGFIGAAALTLYFPPAGIPFVFLLYKQNLYRHWDYNFRIIQTKGFELEKKHVKYL